MEKKSELNESQSNYFGQWGDNIVLEELRRHSVLQLGEAVAQQPHFLL